MFRAFRYRLYPTPEQEQKFREIAGVCRFVYNLALEQREREWTHYRDNGVHLNLFQQINELTLLRAEVDWIRAVPRACEEAALRDLDRGFANFFAGRGRYPTFHRRGINESFRLRGYDSRVTPISEKWSTVRVAKVGPVKFRDTRPRPGKVKTVTVILDALGWFVSFACEIEHKPPDNSFPAVGMDRGIANTLALSTGEMMSLPRALPRIDAQRRRAQRTVARRVKGSNRRKRAVRRVAALSARIARIRRDWHHKVSTQIADRFGTVVMEDLKVVNMTARGRGKHGLNRSILNQGWSSFATLLSYKLEERGGALVTVPAAYSSQTCSACGTVDSRSRESQARFVCRHCGFEGHADTNAAIVLLRRNTASQRVEGSHWRPDEARTDHQSALAA